MPVSEPQKQSCVFQIRCNHLLFGFDSDEKYFLMSRSKLSKVGTQHTCSSMFTEKKFLLCLQIKGLCERRKERVELLKPVLLPKLVLPNLHPHCKMTNNVASFVVLILFEAKKQASILKGSSFTSPQFTFNTLICTTNNDYS